MVARLMPMVAMLLMTVCAWSSSLFIQSEDDQFEDYYKPYTNDSSAQVHTTSIDYSEIAQQITEGCDDDYQKIKAIYQWLCANIDYDITYSIHSADSCLTERRGVCQAYCELFYQIAKPLDIRVEIVNGFSKDNTGFISDIGHSWLFAYTRPERGILLDPTWGAGSLQDNRFVRNENCWMWFNVSPEWMILSHFPNNVDYQMTDSLMTMEEFRTMPPAHPLWREYGLDTHSIYQKLRNGGLSLPTFYGRGEGELQFMEIPLCDSLTIGQTYTFRIRMKSDREFVIINNKERIRKKDWKDEGNGVYSTTFMPRDTMPLFFGLKDRVMENYWNYMVEYAIKPPTAADWELVEKVYPLSVPEAKAVAHLLPEGWRLAGIDDHQLLSLIREQHLTSLPDIFYREGQRLTIVSVPMSRQLECGKSYTFSFRPTPGTQWAIINEGTWQKNWEVKDGVYTITVTPGSSGTLSLNVQMREGGPYVSCLAYEVK